jgi:hypothetical protein
MRALIPKDLAHTVKALEQSQPSDGSELRVIPQHLWQSIIRNPAAQMMDVVHADIGGEPAQDDWQVIMRTAMQPGFVKIPALVMSLERMLELVLDIEQPDADRGGEKRDRQLHEQE